MTADPFSTEMFWGRDDMIVFVRSLEAQVLMMPDDDQTFVTGCRMHLETGGILNANNLARLKSIGTTLTSARHNTLGGVLSMRTVLVALAGAIHTLNPQEKHFANQMALKLQAKQDMNEQEITQLLAIYAAKGF